MAGLARVVIRFRYVVIAGWLIAAALCTLLLPSLADSVNTDNTTFLPASTPTQHALTLAAPFQPAGTTTGTLVVVGKAKLSSTDQSDIISLQAKIAKDAHVMSVSGQGLSTDGKADKAGVVFTVSTSSPDASSTVAAVRATISAAHLPSGLRGYLTGQLPPAVDHKHSQASAQKLTAELSDLVILVMLIIVFRAVL